MKKKMRKFQDGGETEFESKQGQNPGIGDDVRARAMEYIRKQNEPSSELVKEPPVAKAKSTPKAAPKTESYRPPEEKGLERVSPELDILPIGKAAAALGAGYAAARALGKRMLANRAEKEAAEAAAEKTAKAAATRAANKTRKSEEGFSPAEALKARKKAGMKAGGSVRSASSRADGCAIRGKTRA